MGGEQPAVPLSCAKPPRHLVKEPAEVHALAARIGIFEPRLKREKSFIDMITITNDGKTHCSFCPAFNSIRQLVILTYSQVQKTGVRGAGHTLPFGASRKGRCDELSQRRKTKQKKGCSNLVCFMFLLSNDCKMHCPCSIPPFCSHHSSKNSLVLCFLFDT